MNKSIKLLAVGMAAGWLAGASGENAKSSVRQGARASGTGTASVVETGGVPRFAIEGNPIAATAVMPSPAGRPGSAIEQLKAFRKAGVMLSSDVWTMHDMRYNPRQWWLGDGEYDFELFDALAKGLVDASPDGFIFPRIKIDPPKKWCEAHPDEMMDDVSPVPESKAWRALYRRMFKDVIDHVEKSSYAGNVIGYHIGAFHCGEWLTGEWKSAKHRAYLPPVMCDNRDPFPPLSETAARRAAVSGRSEAVADLLIDAASCVKEFTGGRSLVGAFFGYPSIAHEKFMRVVKSGKVDFFAAPPHYGASREPGSAGSSQAHFQASYRLHGRVYFEESDFRTFLSDPAFAPPNAVRRHPLGEAIGLVRRSIGKSLAGGWENWWFLLGGNDTYSAPELMESIRVGVEEERRTIASARWTPAEVAVFTAADEYATSGGGTHANEFRKQCRWDLLVNVLPACGVPFDSYELSDIADPRLPEYKVYLFPNAFTLSEEMRVKIKERVRRAGKTAVWVYAPGYFRNGCGDKANVEDLTGISLERRQLGEPAYAAWMLEPSGSGVCARDGWRSVFMPMPPDATALRRAFREAGAHVWMETEDIIAAGRGYLMVHAASDGEKTIRLPSRCDVSELYGARPPLKSVIEIKEVLKKGETRVYRMNPDPRFIAAVSPDGRNKIRLNLDPMYVEATHDGKTVVAPGRISMKIDGRCIADGGSTRKPAVSTRRITGDVATAIYKKSHVSMSCVETLADFGDWAVRMIARNDGVAYRFEIRRNGKVRVDGEQADFAVPEGSSRCWAHFTGRFGCEETICRASAASDVKTDSEKHRMMYSPFVYRTGGATVAVLESDVRDYPVRYFEAAGQSSGQPYFKSVFAGWPKRTRHTADRRTSLERGGRWVEVEEHCDWLVETDGTRTFPWRAFAIVDEPSRLMENDIVYALAQPADASHDFSWVKPGKVAWDWWNAFDNKGDPDGCTTETYLRFVDFAAKNGVEYVIMDEGWSEKLDIWRFSPRVDVKKVIDHADKRGVGIILWMSWAQVVGDEDRVASHFAKLGAKGFKVDFMDRGDAAVERFLWKFAESCRKARMVVDYHGSHRPVGMERAYPNVLNYEGVHGLEAMKFSLGDPRIVANDVAICFTRMTAGPLDYTPGAMDNYVIGGYPKRNVEEGRKSYVFVNPGSFGTRSRQMAMVALYNAPLQMLCDSPTKYERNMESFAFMSAVPTTWDETRALGGDPDSHAVVARRKGDVWYVAGITCADGRDFSLDTSFLDDGRWDVEMFRDLPDPDAKPTSYDHVRFALRRGEKVAVHMAPAGGFIARLSRSPSVGAAWARPDLVAKVSSGEIKEARASWWGFDKEDSTRYLQAAINSGVPKLIVEKMPSPWVVMPIRGAPNQHVVFEKGAVLLAKRGEFVGNNDWLFYYLFAENARLTGYGATFRMWREDYARGRDGKGRDYKRGEWRHTLAIRNSRNVVVEGLTLEESGGDGANVGIVVKPGCGPVGLDYGTGTPAAFCRDIVLRDLVCDRNHRQGLSVCSVENLLVENCVFKNTKGTWPMDGVDIEPDSPSNRVVNCVFRNCVAENNAGNGFEVALHQFRKTSYPVSVRFENCRTVGSRNAVVLRTGAPASDGGYPQGTIDFDGCSFNGCGYSALHVLQIPENSIKIGFRNCRVSDFGRNDTAAPLAFLEAPRFDDPLPAIPEMSGLACPNLGTRARICFSTRNFATLGEKDVPRLAPEVVDARVVDAAPGEFAECTAPRMQGKLRFAVYADRARKVRIRARRAIPEGPRRPLPKGEIAVTDMSGAPVAKIPLPDYESAELSFGAPKAGFYWLATMVRVGALAVEATDSPIAADCTQFDYLTRPLRFHVSTGSVYVPVAAGQEAAFVVGGDMPGARIGMRVYEPGGKLVFEKGSILEWTRYVTPNAEKDGLWRIEFEKPSIGGMWAYYAEVTGVRPFLFLSKDKYWHSR